MLDFAEAKYEVDESCGTCIVKVVRSGITDKSCSIQFDTSDGDASSTDDYVSTAGTLQFKADETEKEISITIIDDNEWAPDKHFFVRLYGAKAEGNSGVEIKVNTATTQVIILNDDDPGSIGFQAKPFHAVLQWSPSTMQHTRGPSSGPHMPQNARRGRTKGVLPRGPPAPPSPLLLGASCPRAYGKIVAYSAGLSS